jgi:hypothetical protein
MSNFNSGRETKVTEICGFYYYNKEYYSSKGQVSGKKTKNGLKLSTPNRCGQVHWL